MLDEGVAVPEISSVGKLQENMDIVTLLGNSPYPIVTISYCQYEIITVIRNGRSTAKIQTITWNTWANLKAAVAKLFFMEGSTLGL